MYIHCLISEKPFVSASIVSSASRYTATSRAGCFRNRRLIPQTVVYLLCCKCGRFRNRLWFLNFPIVFGSATVYHFASMFCSATVLKSSIVFHRTKHVYQPIHRDGIMKSYYCNPPTHINIYRCINIYIYKDKINIHIYIYIYIKIK